MKTTISSEGRIALPAELRKKDRVVPGQRFEIERLRAGVCLLRKGAGPGEPGLEEWLCNGPSQD